MTDARHPDLEIALDRSRLLTERQDAFRRYEQSMARHSHADGTWHRHVNGEQLYHSHREPDR